MLWTPPPRLLKAGEVIRTWKLGLLAHEGVYLGNGSVIDYANGNEVRVRSLDEFSGSKPVEIVWTGSERHRSEVVKRALSRIGEQRYSLFFNNCQHFVTWCIFGEATSWQLECFERAHRTGKEDHP